MMFKTPTYGLGGEILVFGKNVFVLGLLKAICTRAILKVVCTRAILKAVCIGANLNAVCTRARLALVQTAFRMAVVAASFALISPLVLADDCVECHKEETRSIVADWQISRHQTENVGCSDCHTVRPLQCRGHNDSEAAAAAGSASTSGRCSRRVSNPISTSDTAKPRKPTAS